MWYPGINLGLLHASQVSYLLYYLFKPFIASLSSLNFLSISILNSFATRLYWCCLLIESSGLYSSLTTHAGVLCYFTMVSFVIWGAFFPLYSKCLLFAREIFQEALLREREYGHHFVKPTFILKRDFLWLPHLVCDLTQAQFKLYHRFKKHA